MTIYYPYSRMVQALQRKNNESERKLMKKNILKRIKVLGMAVVLAFTLLATPALADGNYSETVYWKESRRYGLYGSKPVRNTGYVVFTFSNGYVSWVGNGKNTAKFSGSTGGGYTRGTKVTEIRHEDTLSATGFGDITYGFTDATVSQSGKEVKYTWSVKNDTYMNNNVSYTISMTNGTNSASITCATSFKIPSYGNYRTIAGD